MSAKKFGMAALMVLAISACASDGTERPPKVSANDMCGPGETLICEVRNTGRITHGTFNKRNTTCACEEAKSGATVIPTIGGQ